MSANAPTASPPAPRPCRARKAISSVMDWAAPDSTEPMTKIAIAARNTFFRPRRSPTLPQTGVEMAVVSV